MAQAFLWFWKRLVPDLTQRQGSVHVTDVTCPHKRATQGCKGHEWREVCGRIAALCPSLQRLKVNKLLSSFSAEPLQQLRSLCSLDLHIDSCDLATAVPGLGSLTGLTRLTLSSAPDYHQEYDVDISALGQLQDLEELMLLTALGFVSGLHAVATGCSQLTRLVLDVGGVEAEEAGQAGAGAAPWWPCLEEVEYLSAGEPGHLAALHLDRAQNLRAAWAEGGCNMFSELALDPYSHTSRPKAITELCQQLAALPTRFHPPRLTLVVKR